MLLNKQNALKHKTNKEKCKWRHRDIFSVGDGDCPRYGDQHKDGDYPYDEGCPRDSKEW